MTSQNHATAQTADDVPEAEKPLDLEDLPLKPAYWMVLLQPLQPPKKQGSIELTEDTIKAQEYLVTMAEILALGPLACEGITKGGLDLSKQKLAPGMWVIYPKYVGHEVKLVTGQKLLLLEAMDLIAIVERPRLIKLWN